MTARRVPDRARAVRRTQRARPRRHRRAVRPARARRRAARRAVRPRQPLPAGRAGNPAPASRASATASRRPPAGGTWRVIEGHGHSPEHAALYCGSAGILISGDMLLPRISTNISVWAVEPDADPLARFLDSLIAFEALPPDTLVLPSHGLPFRGIARRVAAAAARTTPPGWTNSSPPPAPPPARSRAADLVPVLFRRRPRPAAAVLRHGRGHRPPQPPLARRAPRPPRRRRRRHSFRTRRPKPLTSSLNHNARKSPAMSAPAKPAAARKPRPSPPTTRLRSPIRSPPPPRRAPS